MLNFTAHQGYNSQNITRCEINIKRYGGISVGNEHHQLRLNQHIVA